MGIHGIARRAALDGAQGGAGLADGVASTTCRAEFVAIEARDADGNTIADDFSCTFSRTESCVMVQGDLEFGTVPEPSSIVLVATGLLGIGGLVRRKPRLR